MNKYNPVQGDMFASFDATPVTTTSKTPVKPASDIPTLVEYANRIATRVWSKEHTRKHNLRGCQWFAEYKDYGQLTLADIKKGHIYNFAEHLMDSRGISPNSANKYMAAISRVMREANKKDIIDNPIKLEYEKVKSGRPRFFTREEEGELCNLLKSYGHSWMADMVIFSCNTGCRKSEIRAITNPEVEVTKDDDGDLWMYLPESVTKNGEERYVPLNAHASAAYERLLPVIDKAYSHRTFYWFWNKAKREIARNDPHFVFHVCRHTAATRLANEVKASEFNIADILGHKDTRVTRLYVHSKKKVLASAVKGL